MPANDMPDCPSPLCALRVHHRGTCVTRMGSPPRMEQDAVTAQLVTLTLAVTTLTETVERLVKAHVGL